MSYVAKDFSRSTLAGAIAAGATSLTVQTGHGDRFPVVTAPDYTTAIITDGAGNYEKIQIGARASGSDTASSLTRGLDGTTARAWSSGVIIFHGPDATLFAQVLNHMAAADPHTQYMQKAVVDMTGTVAMSGDISPTALSASVNDYAPAGLSGASSIRLDSSAAYSLTGLTGGADGRVISIENISAFGITLVGESTASSAANRFASDVFIPPKRAAVLKYDSTSSRWRLLDAINHGDLQSQLATAATTAGTATAFTLSPSPATTANAARQRFRVTFHTAAGASPTLSVSGQAALALKYKDATGTKQAITSTQAPSGFTADIECDGTDWVLLQTADAVSAGTPNVFKAGQASTPNAPTFSATMTLDMSKSNHFSFTATASFTLANPTNANPGQSGTIEVNQDATGSRAISAWGAKWKAAGGTKPVLSTAANSRDLLSYVVLNNGDILVSSIKAIA